MSTEHATPYMSCQTNKTSFIHGYWFTGARISILHHCVHCHRIMFSLASTLHIITADMTLLETMI